MVLGVSLRLCALPLCLLTERAVRTGKVVPAPPARVTPPAAAAAAAAASAAAAAPAAASAACCVCVLRPCGDAWPLWAIEMALMAWHSNDEKPFA